MNNIRTILEKMFNSTNPERSLPKAEQELINYFKGLIPDKKDISEFKKQYTLSEMQDIMENTHTLANYNGFNDCRSQILQELEKK